MIDWSMLSDEVKAPDIAIAVQGFMQKQRLTLLQRQHNLITDTHVSQIGTPLKLQSGFVRKAECHAALQGSLTAVKYALSFGGGHGLTI
eukprot:5587858-Amphidinium_carterae.1